jgi:hypothetical protein
MTHTHRPRENGPPMAKRGPVQPAPTPGRFAGQIHIHDGALDPLTQAEADAWGV